MEEKQVDNVVFITYQYKADLIYSPNAGNVHWCVNAYKTVKISGEKYITYNLIRQVAAAQSLIEMKTYIILQTYVGTYTLKLTLFDRQMQVQIWD